MPARAILGVVFVATLIACGTGTTRAGSSYSIGLIVHDGVRLHESPAPQSPTLAVLVEQTQVEILARHPGWDRVRIWASIVGWVLATDIDGTRPWESTSHYRAPKNLYPVHAHAPQRLQADAISTASVALASRPGTK